MSQRLSIIIKVTLICAGAFLFAGCYTKIASFQAESTPSGAAARGECVDCAEELPVSNRREVCVWQRDIFGFPEMRCYTTNYASSWVYFHNTPWWYRNQYSWYDNRGCPAYYYYDRISGVCRYYGGSYRPPSGGGGGGGSSGGSSGGTATPRRGLRGASSAETPVQPLEAPYSSGGPMFTGGAKNLSPAGSPVSVPAATPSTPSTPSGGGLAKPQDTPTETPPQVTPPPPQNDKQQPKRRGLRG